MSASNLELSAPVAAELIKAARDGYVTLTRAGRPVAYILPTSFYDEEDLKYMTDPAFWKMIQARRTSSEPTVSLEEVMKDLDTEESGKAHPAKKNGPRRKKSHAPA